jgi:hypothetical protein
MIKTLRITSYFAVVLAVVFFALPAVFGFRGDKQIEQFLNSAGVIEGFKGAKGEMSGEDKREISPLVKQAEAFALYLNPPPKPEPVPSAPAAKNEPRPAGPVTAKFKLIGTSRHVLQPELSLALIDEPGKGLYWVRQSSKIGHLIVEQVKDGVVVVRDGSSTFELVAERPEERSLLKANTSSLSGAAPANTNGGRITGELPPETPALAAQTATEEVPVSAEEKEMSEAELKKALAEMDAMLAEGKVAEEAAEANLSGAAPAKTDVQVSETESGSGVSQLQADKAKEIAAARRRSASDLETMRISAREARGLGRLGRRLRNVQREPNQAEGNRAKSDAALIEPNSMGPNSNEPDLNDENIPG